MSPPACSGRNEPHEPCEPCPHVAPLLRGADGAARRPYQKPCKGRDIALRCPRPRAAGGTNHVRRSDGAARRLYQKPCKGRDIALRCPRPRAAGGTNHVSRANHAPRCAAERGARTAQRAVPTKTIAKVGTSRCDVPARVQRAERTTRAARTAQPVLSILRSRATAEDGRSSTAEGGRAVPTKTMQR